MPKHKMEVRLINFRVLQESKNSKQSEIDIWLVSSVASLTCANLPKGKQQINWKSRQTAS